MADWIMACKRLRLDGFTLGVLVLGAVYTALGWTPSSYGAVLSRLAQPRAGLVFGEPREIREDEWARWTPLFQAAVRNDFERTNHTSLYREDLRNVEGLPLRDWGLLFKPYYWPFFLVSPARAFSFTHAFWICAFLVGYHHAFRALRIPRTIAAAASVTLFFTGFVQTWWTTYGPMLAGYPWLLLTALAPLHPGTKALAMTCATASWLLALLYPPIQITLMFTGALLVLGLRRDLWRARDVVASLAGLLLGAALAFLYYRDVFHAMRLTLYPGQRVMSGGSEPLIQWLAQVLPFLVTSGFDNLVSENVCEASTVRNSSSRASPCAWSSARETSPRGPLPAPIRVSSADLHRLRGPAARLARPGRGARALLPVPPSRAWSALFGVDPPMKQLAGECLSQRPPRLDGVFPSTRDFIRIPCVRPGHRGLHSR